MRKRAAIIVAILTTLTLAACGGPSPNDAEEAARQFCVHHGGVGKVEYYRGDLIIEPSFSAECKDGSEIN